MGSILPSVILIEQTQDNGGFGCHEKEKDTVLNYNNFFG